MTVQQNVKSKSEVLTTKLWAKHWVTVNKRPFVSFRKEQESNLLLVSIDEGSIGEREIPVMSQVLLRHYMSNIFVYLMPADTDENQIEKSLVHGWELKIGLPIEEAKEFATELLKTIELCEKRREERHKNVDAEASQ